MRAPNARDTALRVLVSCRTAGAWADAALRAQLRRDGLSGPEAALCSRIVYGVMQNRLLLDFYLGAYCSQKVDHLQPPLLEILRIGAYQILFLDKIPHSAAVNQAVEQAKECGDTFFTTTKPLVLAGVSSMVGALFGNPLAVGLYWGYPGWKKMGSGTGYHLGIVVLYALVGLTGLSAIITAFIPEAVVLPILVFVGISSYSQAFEVVTKKYYPAVIMASLPVVMDFIMDNVAEGKLAGFSAFDNGSAFVGLLVGCVFVFIIDNDWLKAPITNVVALALTGIGMIHSPGLLFTESYSPNLGFVAVYCVLIVGFLVLHLIKFNQKAHQADLEAEKAAALAAAKQE